jgi:hypothetical protein
MYVWKYGAQASVGSWEFIDNPPLPTVAITVPFPAV